MNKLKNFILTSFLALRRALVFALTFNHYRVRRIIRQINPRLPGDAAPGKETDEIFIASTFLTPGPERREILRLTMERTLEHLANSGLSVRVIDASPRESAEQNKRIFEAIPGIDLQYRQKGGSMVDAYLELLGNSGKKYFFTLFDDQPILNFTPELLNGACRLLEDFGGRVGLVIWEYFHDFKIDHQNKSVTFSAEHSGKNIQPLGVVKYGQSEFAVYVNYKYGFFFNNLVGNCSDYCHKLKWYKKYVSEKSAHKIELASIWKLGPSYEYIAVPLNSCMFDIDNSHTASAVRPIGPTAQQLFEALSRGYTLLTEKSHD